MRDEKQNLEDVMEHSKENKEKDSIKVTEAEKKLMKEVDFFRSQLVRSLADNANLKKSFIKEKQLGIYGALEKVFREFLPIFDDLQKVEQEKDSKSLGEVIALINKRVEKFLKQNGVDKIVASGMKFDPDLHEAIEKRKQEGKADIVLEVYKEGYLLHNKRLIRPALVSVSCN